MLGEGRGRSENKKGGSGAERAGAKYPGRLHDSRNDHIGEDRMKREPEMKIIATWSPKWLRAGPILTITPSPSSPEEAGRQISDQRPAMGDGRWAMKEKEGAAGRASLDVSGRVVNAGL